MPHSRPPVVVFFEFRRYATIIRLALRADCPRPPIVRRRLLCRADCANVLHMLRSFVGIASYYGLQSFFPEHEHVVRFLLKRASRDPTGRNICYWAVISERAALEVRRHLILGNRLAALTLLDRTAFDIGPILPADLSGATEKPKRRNQIR